MIAFTRIGRGRRVAAALLLGVASQHAVPAEAALERYRLRRSHIVSESFSAEFPGCGS
jgi:hypothetical protein